MNSLKLRAAIMLSGKTLATFAQEVGISLSALQRKLSGTREFKQTEIERIAELLKLTPEQTWEIFFNMKN